MKKRARPRSPNLAAKALGSKIFGLKVVTPRKGYTRKLKHSGGAAEIVRAADEATDAE